LPLINSQYIKIEGGWSLIAIARLATEITAVPLNFRWFLLTFNMKHTKLYTFVCVVFMTSFFVFRLLPIFPLWAHVYAVSSEWHQVGLSATLVCLTGSLAIDCLNTFWFYKIIMMFTKHVGPTAKKTAKTY
jgi:hypothetical protein